MHTPASLTTQPRAAADASRSSGDIPRWVSILLITDVAVAYIVVRWFTLRIGLAAQEAWVPLYAALLLLPFLITAVELRRRPRPALVGFAGGLGLLAAVGGAVPVLFYFGIHIVLGDGDRTDPIWLWILPLAAANFVLARWAVSQREDSQGRLSMSAALAFQWPISAFLLSMYIGIHVDVRSSRARTATERAFRASVVGVQRCAFEWAAEDPADAFPPNLEAMGPAGSRCLSAEDIERSDVRAITYVPSSSTGGSFDGFTITGALAERFGAHPFNVEANELGLVTQWWDSRKVHDWGLSDGVPRQLAWIQDCARAVRRRTGLAASVPELMNAARGAGPGCFATALGVLVDTVPRETDPGSRFVYSYHATRDGYRIEARPSPYGAISLRSYLMTDAGVIHVTVEDRAATTSDWRLPECAPHGVGDCVPTASSDPPRVHFIHPDSLSRHEGFYLRVRVPGNYNRVPQGIEWTGLCNVPADEALVPPPTDFMFERRELRCSPLWHDELPLGDRLIVRVWLRNKAGDVFFRQDTIRVIDP